MDRPRIRPFVPLLLGLSTLFIGGALHLTHQELWASRLWTVMAGFACLGLLVSMIRAWRRSQWGVDGIALIAMGTAILYEQALVAAVIALMLSGGQALEAYANGRAQSELERLIKRAPQRAWRYCGATLEEVAVQRVEKGDRLFVRSGEVVPADGIVVEGAAVLDESVLSGEAMPVYRARGETIRSGVVNAGAPFDLHVTAPSAESTYARIVRLSSEARQSRAPMARLADRYALAFVPLALIAAGLAWYVSGNHLRALAVLVVATPCPLLLAVPIAMVAGMSRAAHHGVLVKSGRSLETLAQVSQLFIDKTGTLTVGHVQVCDMETAGAWSPSTLLQWAASLAQGSSHVVAKAMVAQARSQQIRLDSPKDVVESAGAGMRGRVGNHDVAMGSLRYLVGEHSVESLWVRRLLSRVRHINAGCLFVMVDGELAGAVAYKDPLRIDTPRCIRRLRAAGVTRIVMLTGDVEERAHAIAEEAGIDEVRADLTPEQKLAAVVETSAKAPTLMIGDGINDAPALAAASVSLAVGYEQGVSAAQEAADVVLLDVHLDRIPDVLHIARDTRRIALQCVIAGMGLSFVAMLLAAMGWLVPLAGALVQEGIDVAVIVYALRALGPRRAQPVLATDMRDRLEREHAELAPILDRIHQAAETLGQATPARARHELADIVDLLGHSVIPHERNDDIQLYPDLARRMPGNDPLASLSQTHREIFRLCRLLDGMNVDGDDPSESATGEIQRLLVRLDTVLRLHLAQEDELFDSLSSPPLQHLASS